MIKKEKIFSVAAPAEALAVSLLIQAGLTSFFLTGFTAVLALAGLLTGSLFLAPKLRDFTKESSGMHSLLYVAVSFLTAFILRFVSIPNLLLFQLVTVLFAISCSVFCSVCSSFVAYRGRGGFTAVGVGSAVLLTIYILGLSSAAVYLPAAMCLQLVLSLVFMGILVRRAKEAGLGAGGKDSGREAVFDGARKLRSSSLNRMRAPKAVRRLFFLEGLGIGAAAITALYADSLVILIVLGACMLGAIFWRLFSGVSNYGTSLIVGSAVTLISAVASVLLNTSSSPVVYITAWSLFGIGLAGVLTSMHGFVFFASDSLAILLNIKSPAYVAGPLFASIFKGAATGILFLLLLRGASPSVLLLICASVFLLASLAGILTGAESFKEERRLAAYLKSAGSSEANVVEREALLRTLIRRSDAHDLPDPVLYFFGSRYFRYICKKKYGLVVNKKCEVRGPALFLSNHSSNFDYKFIAGACIPLKINFMATYYWFTFKKLRPWLRRIGVIQKYQFATDITAMRKLKYIVREKGGCTYIAPEGTVYGSGKGGYINPAICKIVKFLGVPVYSAKIEGAGLGHGKWQKVQQKNCRVDMTIDLLFNAEEVKTLSTDEIYQRICTALAFDDFEYQKRTNHQTPGKDRALGLEDLLYKCPACGEELTLKTEGDRIFCTGCGLEASLNDSYLFNWKDKAFFENYSQWFDWQMDEMEREMRADPDWELCAPVIYKIDIVDTDGYVEVGRGTLSVSLKDGWTYRGTKQGETVIENDSLKEVMLAVMKMGTHVELPYKNHSRCFVMDGNGSLSQKFHVASRVITERILK